MGSKKLVWCCIAGIILGYFAPMVFGGTRSTSLSVGMVGGLALGYLLDMLDEKKTKNAGSETLTEKAREANLLMERARAEVEGRPVQEPVQDTAETAAADETTAAKAGMRAGQFLAPILQIEDSRLRETEDHAAARGADGVGYYPYAPQWLPPVRTAGHEAM